MITGSCGSKTPQSAKDATMALKQAAGALRTGSYRFTVGYGGVDYFEGQLHGVYDAKRGCSVTFTTTHGQSPEIRILALPNELYLLLNTAEGGQRWSKMDRSSVKDLPWVLEAIDKLTAVPGDPSGAAALTGHISAVAPTDVLPPGKTTTGSPLPEVSGAGATARIVAGDLDWAAASAEMALMGFRAVALPDAAPLPPSQASTAPYRLAAQLDETGKLLRLTFWQKGRQWPWNSIVVTGYGDVSAELKPPDPAQCLTGNDQTLLDIAGSLNILYRR
jgi:hypothetical protein